MSPGRRHSLDATTTCAAAARTYRWSASCRARWLIAEKLLDQLAITLLPVLTRSGVRLFPETSDEASPAPTGFTLTQATTLGSGAMHLVYEPT
jgi:hypothetical protein